MRGGKLIRFDEKLLTEIKIEALRQGVSYRKLMAQIIKDYLVINELSRSPKSKIPTVAWGSINQGVIKNDESFDQDVI